MKLVIMLVTLALTTCGGSTKVPSSIKEGAIACATVDIGRTIPEIGMTIFQDVMAVIQAGSAGWEDKLLDIGKTYGKDVLACAAKAVFDALTAHPPGEMAAAPSPAALRAKSFIESQAYRYQ